MKKLLMILLVAVVCSTSFLFISCDGTDSEIAEQTKSDIYEYYETFKDNMQKSEDEKEFAKNLKSFFKEIGFKSVIEDDGNIIVKKKATEGYEKAEPIVFHTEFTKTDYKECCQAMAVGIATMKNSQAHGDLTMIMTRKANGKSIGTEKIDDKYLKNANVINLMSWSKTEIFNGAAGTKVYTMTSDGNKRTPYGTAAYKVKISNLSEADSGNRTDKHTNPIVTLSNMLSNARSSGLNIEIAEFKSSGDVTQYPTGAEVVVVVDKSSKSKFEGRLEKAEESFQEKNRKRDPDATFEFEEVNIPAQALGYDETANLLSLLYTLEDGIFATTEEDYEGDTLGICTIADISMEDGIKVTVMGRNIDEETATSMDETMKMTSQLTDYKCTIKDRYNIWMPNEENYFVKEGKLKEAMEANDIDRKVKYTFTENPCSIIQSKNKDVNIISIGINIEESADCASALIDYLEKMMEQ